MKSAKVLGDRAIDGTFVPDEDIRKQIDNYVTENVLPMFKTDNPGDAGNARDQLARLWHLAVPSLLEAAKLEDIDIAYNALDALLQIRNEQVVRGLISMYENSEDKSVREKSLRSFGMITAIHAPRLSYRPLPEPAETKKLCDELLTPFLANISETETDTELLQLIKHAQTKLSSPPVDARPKIVYTDETPTATPDDPNAHPPTASPETETNTGSVVSETEESPSPAEVKEHNRLLPFATIGTIVLVLLACGAFFVLRRLRG